MASVTPYASNSFGVRATPVDYTKPGAPTHQIYHGGTILANGNIIGRINSWQPAGAYNREGKHIYEVSKETWGKPVDYVPGIATGFNITYTRGEVWNQELEIAFGYGAVWQDLTDQSYPLEATEMLFRGVNVYRSWKYFGCWFTEKNPSAWENQGDGIITLNCGMAYVSRQRTQ